VVISSLSKVNAVVASWFQPKASFFRSCVKGLQMDLYPLTNLLLSRGARRRLATEEAHIVSLDEVLCVGKGFLIMKLWLRFRSRHLVLWSLGTYGLRESG
jgi:hypothetical protein